jgi:hypothetical protein
VFPEKLAHKYSQQYIHSSQKVKTFVMSTTGEWIKRWSIHMVEYYSALKEKGILTHATT